MKTLISTLAGLTLAAGLALSPGVAHAESPSVTEAVKGYNFHNLTKQEALTSYLNKVAKPKHAPPTTVKQIRDGSSDYQALTNALAKRLDGCEYEDSKNCVWFAQERGNGIGNSFVNVRTHLFFFAPYDGLS